MAGPSLGPWVLSLSVAILLLGAFPTLGERLASANFKVDVAATVAGAAAGANFRVCAGAGCMAVPPPAAPAAPAAPAGGVGGGGGGGGGSTPTPVAAAPPEPVLETAAAPPSESGTPPEPTSTPKAFVPPLPLPDRSPARSSPALSLPGPLVVVAAAGALAALLLLRGVAGRVPGAADEEEMAVAPRTEVIGGNCPFCGDFIKGIGLIVPCPSCRAVHHPECWAQNGGCTTLGCARAPARPGSAEAAE